MSRIQIAFILYIALAAIAGSSLRGDFRTAVLIFLAGLALKSWIAHRKESEQGVGPSNGTTASGTIEDPPLPPQRQTKES